MCRAPLLFAAFSLVSAVVLPSSESRTVSLPFLKVTGFVHDSSAGIDLPTPILSWYSIPYAAPPTGPLRFSYPQPPIKSSQPSNNTDYGPLCLQAPGEFPLSEDCLTLSVFAPAGTTPDAKLPVVVWIPGGSFNLGGGRSFNMPSMISNAPAPFIGVSINYRLGALQSLSSELAHEANTLNLGFADQRASLRFVQRYISLFGGDPNKVTLFGESAGAHSVGYHLLHEDLGATKLFHQVIMDSGAPTARAFPNYTYPIYETQTHEFLGRVGCEDIKGAQATFKCLRSLNASLIQNVSASFNSDEGSIFAPQNLTTNAEFKAWWQVLVPSLTCDLLEKIEELYPSPYAPDSPYAKYTKSPQYERMVAAYGDYAYISQVQNTAVEVAKWEINGASVYKYHFAQTVGNNTFVYHASELAFISVAGLTGDAKALALLMNAYYTSCKFSEYPLSAEFTYTRTSPVIVTGDPNLLLPSDSTAWPTYRTDAQNQLRFQGTQATVEADDIRREATEFWRSIPEVLQH
ncbi:hypothetical protein P7C70_g4122, partial [Phenoliferia sp. Uapishka_3]